MPGQSLIKKAKAKAGSAGATARRGRDAAVAKAGEAADAAGDTTMNPITAIGGQGGALTRGFSQDSKTPPYRAAAISDDDALAPARGLNVEDDDGPRRTGKELWAIVKAHLTFVVGLNRLLSEGRVLYGDMGQSSTRAMMQSEDPMQRQRAELHDISTPDEELKWIIHPNGDFRTYWDLAQIVFLLYVTIMVPYRAAFEQDTVPFSAGWWWELVVDVYFICDMVINFLTAYYDKKGFLVANLRRIAFNYFTSWFIIDFFSCLPVSYIGLIVELTGGSPEMRSAGGEIKVLKVARLLRLAKMLRIARIKRIMQQQEETLLPLISSFKLVAILMGMLLVSHFFGCIWFAVGQKPGGWVEYQNFEEGERAVVKYLHAFYWAVTTLTTVGFGDIRAHNAPEMFVSIFVELTGGVAFGLLCGTLSNVIMSTSKTEELYNNKMDEIRGFLGDKGVSVDLKKSIRAFYEQLYAKKSVYDEGDIITTLPDTMSKELIQEIYGKLLRDVPIFSRISDDLCVKICLALTPVTYLQGMTVAEQGEVGRELFIIEEGTVQIRIVDHIMGYLGSSSFFGELELVGLAAGEDGKQRVFSAYAATDVDCLVLKDQEIQKFREESSELDDCLLDFAQRREKKWDMITSADMKAVIKTPLKTKPVRTKKRSMEVLLLEAKNMIEAAQKTQKEQFTALSALMKRHEGLDEGLSAVQAVMTEVAAGVKHAR